MIHVPLEIRKELRKQSDLMAAHTGEFVRTEPRGFLIEIYPEVLPYCTESPRSRGRSTSRPEPASIEPTIDNVIEAPSKEVAIMKRLLMGCAVMAIVSTPVLAGPNADATIVVHNTGIAWTTDLGLHPASPVPMCAAIVDEIPMGSVPGDASNSLVWKVYASFPTESSPRLKSCGWGITLTSDGGGGILFISSGTPNPAVSYLTSAGWPGANSFIEMSFTDGVRTDVVDELFWFAGYAYAGAAGEPQMFRVIPHSDVSKRFFLDDASPQNADPITGYGSLGFGQPGQTPCPACLLPCGAAACCLSDGACAMMSGTNCLAAGGVIVPDLICAPNLCSVSAAPACGACCDHLTGACDVTPRVACKFEWLGDDVPCNPTTCVPAGPNERKSWGQIKNGYR